MICSEGLKPKLFLGHVCEEEDNAYGSGNDLDFHGDAISGTHAVVSCIEKSGFAIKVRGAEDPTGRTKEGQYN